VLRAEIGRADQPWRPGKRSYFSEFFLAQHTLVPEIFVGGERAFPIAAVREA